MMPNQPGPSRRAQRREWLDKRNNRTHPKTEEATVALTHPTFPSFHEATKYCDEWAGDTEQYIVVVEDFETDELYVMTAADAEEFLETHDAEIQYDADHEPQES